MTRDQLASMVDAYRDGEIAPADAERLATTIRQRGEESAWVLEELQTAGLVAQALDVTDSEAFLRGFWERQRAEQDSEHFVHDFEEKRAVESAGRSRHWWIAAAMATFVLLAAGASLWMRTHDGSPAHLEQVRGEVVLVHRGVAQPVTSDTPLSPGDGLRITGEESSATIVFADGTRLEFGEDSVVASVTDDKSTGKKVVVGEGFFTAQVAKQPPGRPMILTTPQSEVVVLGTIFSLSVGTAVTHLETQSGNVQFKRTSDGRSVEVPAGFDAIVATADAPLVAQPLTPRSGTPRLQLEGRWTGALSPEAGKLVATRYLKGDVEIWNTSTNQKQAAFRAHDKRTTAAVFSPNGQALITGSLDGSVKWWDSATGQLKATLSPGLGAITDLCPSRDGRSLTVLSYDEHNETRIITSWDMGTRERRWGPTPLLADRLSFSPDGQVLAAARKQDRFVTIWNLETGGVKTVLRENADRSSGLLRNVLSMAFSHDGRTLAVDDLSGLMSFWDIATGKVRTKFQRHGGRIFGMGFSPDDRFLATGQQDDIIRIWDIASPTPIAAFAGYSRTQTRDVTFAADGRTLLTGGIRVATADRSRDGVLQLWDLPTSITPRKSDHR